MRASTALFALALCLPVTASAQEPILDGLRDAAEASPRDYDTLRTLGLALITAAHYREAERVLERAERRQRATGGAPHAEALFDLARVEFARGAYQDARTRCRAVRRIAGDSVIFHVCMANAWIAWGRAARAFESAERALAMDANDYRAILAVADAHRLRGQASEAEAAYRRAIAASQGDVAPHLGLGRVLAAAGRRDEAVQTLRDGRRLDEDHPQINYELGRLLEGREAVTRLRQAIEGRPEWGEAYEALGEALLGTGDAAGAAEAFQRALAISDAFSSSRLGLGRALLMQEDLEGAERELRAGLEQVPNSPEGAMALGDILARTGRVQDAYRQFEHAQDLDPRNPEPMLRATRLAIENERTTLALSYARRLLGRFPDNAQGLALMGDILAARREPDQARDYYQRALSGEGPVDRSAVEAALRAL